MRTTLFIAAAAASLLAACGTASDDSNTQQAQPIAPTTTRPPLPDGACVAAMKDPNPEQGGTETLILDSHFPSVSATFVVHYKSKDSNYSAQLDAKGHAKAQFSIGHPTANFPVKVDVSVNSNQETCSTTFTPR
jgi:hypothetical protein